MCCIFFFQAEDGIRDKLVTGVQTCALPIWACNNQEAQAANMFEQVTQTSTLSETQFNYAQFLAAQGKAGEAKQWAQRVLGKKATMPRYLKRRERPWFRRASALLKRLPA